MQFPNDNRVIIAIGVGLAILAAILLALVFGGKKDAAPTVAATQAGGLTVALADAPSLEPTRELRCFVDGQFVGMATLSNCAQRNGLATDALDVGLDATGNLAAAPTASFSPPPDLPSPEMADLNVGLAVDQPTEIEPGPEPQVQQPRVERPSGAPCLRYAGSEWRQISGDMTLNQCVQALFAGTCVSPGDAQYGSHGGLSLRLVPRRVEQSSDNSRYRILADQDRSCQIPSLN